MKAMALAIFLSVLRQASNSFSVPLILETGVRRTSPYRSFATGQARRGRLFAANKKSDSAQGAQQQKKKGGNKKTFKTVKPLRADRVLSNRGVGSRSECFKLIKQGRVEILRENEEKSRVRGPSEKISVKDTLFVNGEAVPPLPLLVVYHKPKWVLSVMHDPQGRPTIANAIPGRINQLVHPVGRLDYDTSGLLLFSSDGKLTQRLLHPNHCVEKEYVAIVEGRVNFEELDQKLKAGVETTEGTHTAKLVKVEEIESDQVPVLFQTMMEALPPEYNVTDLELRGYLSTEVSIKELSRVQLIVSEGKHRMVRRVLANCGHGVIELKRERQGMISLNDLAPGQSRMIDSEEEAWAEELLRLPKIKTDQNKKK